MKLSASDQTNYPAFANYVKSAFPKLKTNSHIMKALQTHGGMTAAQAKNALSWGTPPLVKVVDLTVVQCGGKLKTWGCTRNAAEIEVAKRFVAQFEVDASKGKDNKNSSGKTVYVAGATILHELSHWGYKLNGKPEPAGVEAGIAFEIAAYGKSIW